METVTYITLFFFPQVMGICSLQEVKISTVYDTELGYWLTTTLLMVDEELERVPLFR